MLIRRIQLNDAKQLLRLRLQLDKETQFMLFDPGERSIDIEEQRHQIERVLLSENQMIFVVEHEGQLVGYLGASGGYARRIHHRVEIVIGILEAFTGQGIGSQLFVAMEKWAREKQLHRLELTVMTHNAAGVALYKKQGFTIEGVRSHSMVVNNRYVDEYYMAKLLE
jgi:RimJ/RimL family protein N-acetyltransferase